MRRYPVDTFDRIWSADSRKGYSVNGTPSIERTTRTFDASTFDITPDVVLQTALVGNSSFNITFAGFSRSYNFLYLLFFGELSDNLAAQKRVFYYKTYTESGLVGYQHDIDLALVDDHNNTYYYNLALVPVGEGGSLTIAFHRESTSAPALGPLLNAVELQYSSPGPMSLGTNDDDVYALNLMKQNLPRFDSWRGDPCLPYSYEWLTCDFEIRPRIIKLSLQNKNITAEIPTEIGNLKALIEIYLQGNNLSGSIPNSIAQLPNLTTLFLQDNNLSGPIPQELLDKKVDLRLTGNPILCKDNNAIYCGQQSVQTKTDEESKKKSYTLLIAILAPTCAVVLILLALIFLFRRKRKDTHAVGLEYLHKGCKPPIIHRDVKCSNILLDEKLEGKISDFGISRLKQAADTQMAVTNVQGTIGYIAPESAELRITEKVDVFAFGVVLLEVVSARRPIEGSQHIINWVIPLMNESRIEVIVDPSIGADYSMSSIWKVLEVAMACVEQEAQQRPDMQEVCSELKLALSYELQSETGLSAYDSSDLSLTL